MSNEVQAQTPGIQLVGDLPVKMWGLPIAEWQTRAWKKAGATVVDADASLALGIDWVLSPALAKYIAATAGTALIVKDEALGQERVAAFHAPAGANATELTQWVNAINPDWDALRAAGFTPGYMDDFVGDYDKALRKREAPYAISLMTTTPDKIEARLFKGSYKGVTDIVTKYAWPIPALHVTRLCANLKITPNMVTTLSLCLVLVAMYCFWIGAWWPGDYYGVGNDIPRYCGRKTGAYDDDVFGMG